MRRGGAIAVIGLPADDAVTYRMNTVVGRELEIRGVFRYANTFPSGVQLVASGQYPLASLIAHRSSLKPEPSPADPVPDMQMDVRVPVLGSIGVEGLVRVNSTVVQPARLYAPSWDP
jgi:hypothetical protein